MKKILGKLFLAHAILFSKFADIRYFHSFGLRPAAFFVSTSVILISFCILSSYWQKSKVFFFDMLGFIYVYFTLFIYLIANY